MTALRPMLIMVCEPCARGDFDQEVVEGCSICNAVAGVPQPARTREEMVEDVVGALSPHLSSRWGQCAGTGDDLRSNLDCTSSGATGYRFPAQGRKVAVEALIAAGVIEEEERDA